MSLCEVVTIKVTCDWCKHTSVVTVDRPYGYFRPDGITENELPEGWKSRVVPDGHNYGDGYTMYRTEHICADCMVNPK